MASEQGVYLTTGGLGLRPSPSPYGAVASRQDLGPSLAWFHQLFNGDEDRMGITGPLRPSIFITFVSGPGYCRHSNMVAVEALFSCCFSRLCEQFTQQRVLCSSENQELWLGVPSQLCWAYTLHPAYSPSPAGPRPKAVTRSQLCSFGKCLLSSG